jgi:glutathione synthase/RimK-type ligase-like ATP-grasp enzyme
MSNFKVYPYKMGSQSAKILARALDAIRVFPDRNYRPRLNHTIINWGSSTIPRWYEQADDVINRVEAVAIAANKLKTFNKLSQHGVSIPVFTTDREVAEDWDGVVVCRKVLNGSQGSGIVIAETSDQIVDAPLYTKHVRHKHEFRVHVMNGEVIDFTQKKKRSGVGEVSNFVRNHEGNWVFCREGVVLPEDVKAQSIKAVEALGLDFGAVDVAYREREDKAFVLEVNTSPGMDEEGTTVQRYAEAFRRNYEV